MENFTYLSLENNENNQTFENLNSLIVDKYQKLIEQTLHLNNTRSLNLNLTCDKTLYELMHIQSRYPLQVLDEKFKCLLQIDEEKKSNDTLELFYIKNYTITPILYELILNMSSPYDIGGLNLPFSNQRTLIFDYTKIFNKEIFHDEYLIPFYENTVRPLLESEYDGIINEPDIDEDYKNFVENSKNFWFQEFSEKLFKNIFIISYSSLLELLIRVQNIPNLTKSIKEISLIIIDSPNLLLNQAVKLEHEDEFKDEGNNSHLNNVNKKINVNFKKKRKSYLKEDQTIYEVINTVLNNLQKEFNFNLIYTFYDFDRVENLNYIKYKMNDQNFSFDNYNKYFNFYIGEEDRIQFIFHMKNFEDKHKIYSIEPNHCYYNFDCNVFGYMIFIGYIEESCSCRYKLLIFMRKRGEGACNIPLLERVIDIERVSLGDSNLGNKKRFSRNK
jgi:hypothetical protein